MTGRTVSLITSLIHLRTPTSIDVYRRSLSRQVDDRGRSCTVILAPEKRKVGGSTPPLTTSQLATSEPVTRLNVSCCGICSALLVTVTARSRPSFAVCWGTRGARRMILSMRTGAGDDTYIAPVAPDRFKARRVRLVADGGGLEKGPSLPSHGQEPRRIDQHLAWSTCGIVVTRRSLAGPAGSGALQGATSIRGPVADQPRGQLPPDLSFTSSRRCAGRRASLLLTAVETIHTGSLSSGALAARGADG